MLFKSLPLAGAYKIDVEPFSDHRGSFARLFCVKELKEIGLEKSLRQINFSSTLKAGTIRGMHYQKPPHAEVKIVRCIKGKVFDVVVDLRFDSPTFLHWHGEILSRENMRGIYIPEGFAHGFQVLEPESELIYLHTADYSPGFEGAVRYDDPCIGIEWPLEVTDISERDLQHPLVDNDFEGIKL
ncbi:dTDP-4-dehydrorhamnose 3,5-epimerase [Maridesulfovibrio sp.]|uniref:dTDP-4-dehydrorhamnose 3,5-epimerase n=1 Tax=Maridesulfovibrio sp. TaxID=2795000 RepID=UPI0029F56A44|nr:dTDP-4-dehydrorhamnose 3,5-epimerase [Maridesulfovibrio sp.]